MTMEIKQGDKVRVSKDAPKMFRCGFNHVYTAYISKVLEVDDGNAIIEMTMANMRCQERIIIPTKYLVKVDAEAKEAKFKVGDKVRMKDGYYKEELHGCIGTIRKIDKCHIYVEIDSTIYPATIHSIEHYTEPTAPKIKIGDRVRSKGYGLEAVVLGIDGEFIAVRRDDGIKQEWTISITELIEPTEQPEAEKKPNVGSIKIPVEVDLTDGYWDAYTDDLAKEVVLKVANKYNYPEEAAKYAVSVAKAVVEGLKRK